VANFGLWVPGARLVQRRGSARAPGWSVGPGFSAIAHETHPLRRIATRTAERYPCIIGRKRPQPGKLFPWLFLPNRNRGSLELIPSPADQDRCAQLRRHLSGRNRRLTRLGVPINRGAGKISVAWQWRLGEGHGTSVSGGSARRSGGNA
jgi:hypothetical protein